MQVGHRLLRDTGIFSSLSDQGCNWNHVICRPRFPRMNCLSSFGGRRMMARVWVMLLLVHLFDGWLLSKFQLNQKQENRIKLKKKSLCTPETPFVCVYSCYRRHCPFCAVLIAHLPDAIAKPMSKLQATTFLWSLFFFFARFFISHENLLLAPFAHNKKR